MIDSTLISPETLSAALAFAVETGRRDVDAGFASSLGLLRLRMRDGFPSLDGKDSVRVTRPISGSAQAALHAALFAGRSIGEEIEAAAQRNARAAAGE